MELLPPELPRTGALIRAPAGFLAPAGALALALAGLAGCPSELPTALAEDCPDPAITWADVQPIFERECVLCHSTDLPVGERQGAPAFTNFDTAEVARVDGFLTWTMISTGRMPPVPLEQDDARAIWTWLSCDGPP